MPSLVLPDTKESLLSVETVCSLIAFCDLVSSDKKEGENTGGMHEAFPFENSNLVMSHVFGE